MLRKLFKEWGRDPASGAPLRAAAPAGCRLYAIGDIHGRADLLADLHAAIAEDHRDRPTDGRDVIVYLGDYVDRGPDSRGVIDCLANEALPGLTSVHLMGNHDEAMLRFLDDATIGPTWASFGGEATLLSYGVRTSPNMIGMRRFEDMRSQLAEKMPPDHIAFLRGLQTSYAAGDYFFAHAGVRPGVPVEQQRREDLLWIRDAFLSSDADHGKIVVHGHTPDDAPQVRANRIGVDTGAFASGVLTCLVLEGTNRRFLATAVAQRPALRTAV
ncbi:MAG: serine/threonine protein phosphatase [Alphaproteobacteria bacterium]|nr:serine/threonine protein phosphatase [Alphaproteobacteria bacterium]